MTTSTSISQIEFEAERAVLGALLHGDVAALPVLADLRGEFFATDSHRVVFETILRLVATGMPVDAITLAGALRDAGDDPLFGRAAHVVVADLFADGAVGAHVGGYMRRLTEAWKKRRLEQVALTMAEQARNGSASAGIVTASRLALEEVALVGASSGITSATAAEILARDPATLQTKYIVDPWVPERAIVVLAAKPGAGKGKLAQDLCVARSTGGTWLDLTAAPGPALFWSGEQGEREDFRVTQALCRGRGIAAKDFAHHFEVVYDPALKFGHPEMVSHVRARLDAHPGLLIVVDSLRRAVDGDENDSIAADAFYRSVLVPFRAAGATIMLLAHPPKTSGALKMIADENMIRGSGDWLAQLDCFMVLRPITRERIDVQTETITMRLTHVKPRSGPRAAPIVVTNTITHDRTPLVAFYLTAATAPEIESADLAGAVAAVAAHLEQVKQDSRSNILTALEPKEIGRPAVEAALQDLVARKLITGPLKIPGKRGHWYAFVAPLVAPSALVQAPPGAQDDPDDDDVPF